MEEPCVKAGDVTRLLRRAGEGDRGAFDELVPRVYGELKRVAARQLRRERRDSTIDGTSLVHEAYLRLVNETGVEWAGRAHFYAVAARAMRQALVDHARRRGARKRGGDWGRVVLRSDHAVRETADDELLELDEALERLGRLDETQRRVVECRFFAGMTDAEVAEALGVSERTVGREWTKARAWLYRELYGKES